MPRLSSTTLPRQTKISSGIASSGRRIVGPGGAAVGRDVEEHLIVVAGATDGAARIACSRNNWCAPSGGSAAPSWSNGAPVRPVRGREFVAHIRYAQSCEESICPNCIDRARQGECTRRRRLPGELAAVGKLGPGSQLFFQRPGALSLSSA